MTAESKQGKKMTRKVGDPFLSAPLICFCSLFFFLLPTWTARNMTATSTARVSHNSPQIISAHRGREFQVTAARLGESDKQAPPATCFLLSMRSGKEPRMKVPPSPPLSPPIHPREKAGEPGCQCARTATFARVSSGVSLQDNSCSLRTDAIQ